MNLALETERDIFSHEMIERIRLPSIDSSNK